MEFDNSIYDQIESFISGKMNEDEKHLFESKIQSDQNLRKEVDLHRSLKTLSKDTDWNLIEDVKDNIEFNKIRDIRRSKKYIDLELSIREVGDQYFENEKKTKRQRTWLYYAGAAVAVICISFFINYYNNPSTNALYKEYGNWNDLPSLIVQSDDENILAKGEQFFLDAEYEKAIVIFSNKLQNTSIQRQNHDPYILSYLGASYLGLNDYENAILTFDKLLDSNTIDSSKGYWYKAMVYLKQGNKQKIGEQLKIILQSRRNYNFHKAEELCKKLDLSRLCI